MVRVPDPPDPAPLIAVAEPTDRTFTVVRRSQAPGFKDAFPYVRAYVELAEGVQMLTTLVDVDPARVAIGMPVEVVFEDVTADVTLPRFRPIG